MGGRSSSRQETRSSQSTQNIVNDGTFAGASNVSVDESDNSVNIEDSGNTDNSVSIEDSGNTTTETDIDDSFNVTTTTETETNFEDSFNTDNSVTNNFSDESDRSDNRDQSINDAFNTDNSVSIENDGEFAGNSGTINILDSGAVEGGLTLANNAIVSANAQLNSSLETAEGIVTRFAEAAENSTIDFIDASQDNLEASLNFATGALGGVQNIASNAITALRETEVGTLEFAREQSETFAGELGDITSSITSSVFDFAQTQTQGFRDSLENSAREFATNVGSIAASTNASNQAILESLSDSQTQNLGVLTGLSESQATGGQSIVAESSVQVVQVVSVAFVALAIAIALRGRK